MKMISRIQMIVLMTHSYPRILKVNQLTNEWVRLVSIVARICDPFPMWLQVAGAPASRYGVENRGFCMCRYGPF